MAHKRLVKLEQKRYVSQKTGEAGAKEVWLTKDRRSWCKRGVAHKRVVKLEQKRCVSQKTGEAGEKEVWLTKDR